MSYVAFIVPCKETLLPGSPHTAPIERDAPFTERFFTVSQSPRGWGGGATPPPPPGPPGGPPF